MSLQDLKSRRSTRPISALLLSVFVVLAARGDEPVSAGAPQSVTEDDFAALKQQSPFLRSLGASDSMVLGSMARVGEKVYVMVVDAKTRESRLVSTVADREGWRLVGFEGDETNFESLTAKIQVGSQVVSIRYEKLPPRAQQIGPTRLRDSQSREARHAAVNFKEGFSADGFPRQPPPDIVEKLSRMSAQQRETINREMIELRNRGLGMEERRRIYVDKVNRASRR